MSILKDVLAELFGMFLGDAWLSAAVLAVVAIAATLIDLVHLPALAGGAFLLTGCLGVLVAGVRRAARARKPGP